MTKKHFRVHNVLQTSFVTFSVIFSDINELNLPKTCQVDFPDPDDLLTFKLVIAPDEVTNITFALVR